MYNQNQYQYKHIAGVSSPVVFTGSGTLHAVTINGTGAGGTITITDTTSPSATVGIITAGSPITLLYDVAIAAGLQITTTASPDITVTYTKG